MYTFCPNWMWVKTAANPNTGWVDKRASNPNNPDAVVEQIYIDRDAKQMDKQCIGHGKKRMVQNGVQGNV